MTSTPVKAFMDDMFLMSLSIPATQVLLDRYVTGLIWARIFFRASKSRYIVIEEKKEYKVWILQNMLIPRLRWHLLIYEISISVVNHLEHKTSSYLRKWFNIHDSTTNLSLYSLTSPCLLPLKSLT